MDREIKLASQAPLKRVPGRNLDLMLRVERRMTARLDSFFAFTARRVSKEISAQLARDGLGKWAEDTPRDDHGRWESGGTATIEHSAERAWSGKQEPNATRLGKQEAGKLGEAVALAYVQSLGPDHADAQMLNADRNNYPVDAIGDHELYEVKTGQVSNTPAAQQWRATIGQPGKAETAWLKTASAEDKRAVNQLKAQAIMDRKSAALTEYSARLGAPMVGKTITVLLHPDKGVADVHVFDGFHARIGYNSDAARAAYVGSFRYHAG